MLPVVRAQVAVFAIAGLMAGLAYAFGGAAYDGLVTSGIAGQDSSSGLGSGTALAFLAILGMPVLFGIAGLKAGAIEAVACRVVARGDDTSRQPRPLLLRLGSERRIRILLVSWALAILLWIAGFGVAELGDSDAAAPLLLVALAVSLAVAARSLWLIEERFPSTRAGRSDGGT